jgi:hypothetical protein
MNTSATNTSDSQFTPQRSRTMPFNATSPQDRFGVEDVQGIAQGGHPRGLNGSNDYATGTIDDVTFRMSSLLSKSPTTDRPANPSPPSEFLGSTTVVDDRLLLSSQVSKRLERAVTDSTYFASRQFTVLHTSSIPTRKPLPSSAFETPTYAQLSKGALAKDQDMADANGGLPNGHTQKENAVPDSSWPIRSMMSALAIDEASDEGLKSSQSNPFASPAPDDRFAQPVTIKRKPVAPASPANSNPEPQCIPLNTSFCLPESSSEDDSGSERRSSTYSSTTVADDGMYTDEVWFNSMVPEYKDNVAVRDFAYSPNRTPGKKESWKNMKRAPDAYETKRPLLYREAEQDEPTEDTETPGLAEGQLYAPEAKDVNACSAADASEVQRPSLRQFAEQRPPADTDILPGVAARPAHSPEMKDADTCSMASTIYQGDKSDIDEIPLTTTERHAQYALLPAPPTNPTTGPMSMAAFALEVGKTEDGQNVPRAHRTHSWHQASDPAEASSSRSTLSAGQSKQPERKKTNLLRRLSLCHRVPALCS